MQKIALLDYEDAITKYRQMAISMGAKDVIQCGSIQDPGVSDIDCILLVDNWDVVRNSWKLLNPEYISPLFSHGPFVCLHQSLPDLLRYTTLRPISEHGLIVEPITNAFKAKFIIAARQSGSLLHFRNVLFLKQSDRQVGLILKSALHSMHDCSVFFKEDDPFHGEFIEYEESLNIFRKELRSGIFNQQLLEHLKNKAFRLLSECDIAVADWIRTEFHIMDIDDAAAMSKFSSFFWAEKECVGEYSHDLVGEVFQLRKFIEETVVGYIGYGALWRGAEFPFHQPNFTGLGKMLWVRRFIKKVMVPIISN